MAQLRRRYSEFVERGAVLLAISSEERARGAEFKRGLKLPFPLLLDPDCYVIQEYGVFHADEPKGRAIARPSTFVLDAGGVIRWRYVGEEASDRPSVDAVLAALAELSENDRDARRETD